MQVSQATLNAYLKTYEGTEAAEAIKEQLGQGIVTTNNDNNNTISTATTASGVPTKVAATRVIPTIRSSRKVRKGKMKYILYIIGFCLLIQGQHIGGGLCLCAAAYLTKE